jgi:hypothetical protein
LNRINWRKLLTRLQGWVNGFLYGTAMSWVMVPYTQKRRSELERLFMLMTVSELMGISLSPQANGLRMLPYLTPQIMHWRRRPGLWVESLDGVDLRHLGH